MINTRYGPCVDNAEHVVEADVDMQTRTTGIDHLNNWHCGICNGLHLGEALVLHHTAKHVCNLPLLLQVAYPACALLDQLLSLGRCCYLDR